MNYQIFYRKKRIAKTKTNIDNRWSLQMMTTLVIGGSKGIGYAIVEELAQLGATVHTCSRNQTQLNESLHEWATKGYKVTGSICDAVSPLDREKLVATVSSEFNGKLNILEVGTCSVKGFSKVLAAA